MNTVRRTAVKSAGRLGASRAARRYASTEHHDAHSSGSHGDHGHHPSGDGNEPLGMQLYIVLALIPGCYGVYSMSRDGKDGSPSAFKKLIAAYSDYNEHWEKRNTLHTKIMEQAAYDRNLFQSSKPSQHITLRFPEMFNTGSPWNVEAGQSADLGALIAHYEKLNAEGEEKKLEALAEKRSSK